MDIIKDIKLIRLRMPEDEIPSKVLTTVLDGRKVEAGKTVIEKADVINDGRRVSNEL